MDLSRLPDEELLRRYRDGESGAFEFLVRRYERELYGYLCRYLGDRSLAEDVFQNTFLQVHAKSHQFEEGRPFRPWLYTIATRQAIDAMRRSGRTAAASLDQQRAEPDGSQRPVGDILEASGPGPLDEAVGSEQRQRIRQTVDQLPDLLRQVILLAYYQGLKYREIADILDIPVGTVKSRLHAALAKLQQAWGAAPRVNDDHGTE